MDIAKAFDKVPHNRLRHKLKWYGVAGKNSKYLGITIQSVLKWSKHIHTITTKASHTLIVLPQKKS